MTTLVARGTGQISHSLLSPIDLIKVEHRFRRDLGDLTTLRNSIFEIGLLHAVVVDQNRNLIAGQRRLEACKQLGWEMIPVSIVESIESAKLLLMAERDENTCRKEMSPLELKTLVDAIWELEKPKAAERMKAGTGPSGREALGSDEAGRALDRAAEAAGTSRSTYRRVTYVADVAADEDAPDAMRDTAAAELMKLEAGTTTPVAAERAVKKAAPRMTTKPQPSTRMHKIDARTALNRVLPQLAGISTALASIGDDLGDIDADEAAAWNGGLVSAIKVLQSTIRKIRETQ